MPKVCFFFAHCVFFSACRGGVWGDSGIAVLPPSPPLPRGDGGQGEEGCVS